MRRTIHRADGNHWPILAGLKKVTHAEDIHNGSLGADILARHVRTKAPVFLEVKKDGKSDLTAKEAAMQATFPLHWARVETLDEALAAVGL